MNRPLPFTLLYISLLLFLPAPPASADLPYPITHTPKHETRAVWLTTYASLDWPRTKATTPRTIRAQQDELRRILDDLARANFNTVLLQTRLRGTVIYPSSIEPWDECLTGTPGAHPGYDPLEFAIQECHARGMELHAWIVAIPFYDYTHLKHPSMKPHRNLAVRFENKWYLDPALPQTPQYLADLCTEIVTRYNVDGIHLDYIRYPDHSDRWNDRRQYAATTHDKTTLHHRRTENITRCVRAISKAIRIRAPWVKLSAASLGRRAPLPRYPFRGWDGTAVHQDAALWMKEGLIDMLFPMMYARGDYFYPFAVDWQDHSAGVPVVPGLGIWFLSPEEKDWPLTDITRQMHFVRALGLGGQACFRYAFLRRKGLYDYLRNTFYAFPALPILTTAKDSLAPKTPSDIRLETTPSGMRLRWSASVDEPFADAPVKYVVYASPITPVDTHNPKCIVATLSDTAFSVSPFYLALHTVHFAVTAMDNSGNESVPARISSPPIKQPEHTKFPVAEALPVEASDLSGRKVLVSFDGQINPSDVLSPGAYILRSPHSDTPFEGLLNL